MPEQPIPEQDPVVTKSYALHYVVAMAILIGTQYSGRLLREREYRPAGQWKVFQHEWKSRYIALLNKETPASTSSQNAVENSADYKALKDDYDQLRQQTKPQVDKIDEQLADVNGKLLAVRSVFTDRRAYVNALNYDIETEKSASGKESYRRELDEYKKKLATVEFPDGSKKSYTFQQLEEAFNEVNAEKNALSLQLGDVLKPVAAANTKDYACVSDHMVDLSTQRPRRSGRKTEDWDPHIVQTNVADANIVDRCESCHMGIREPLKITPALMTEKGKKKPDEYAQAFVSHPPTATIADSRPRQVRLLTLPSRQRPRHHQH